MIPRRVVLENFLSFGAETAVAFTDDEPLWVLCGPNGVGKSAVFDAITYALFGSHRGTDHQAKDKKGQLTRHGTNGFRVEFEFAVGDRAYRITRAHGKNSVERVFRDAGGTWVELDVPGGVNRVREWSERELGLTSEQFTASVLLRQGQADAIITARGADRLAMLKKVIGVERYEALSDRVKKAATAAENRKKVATAAAADVPAVTPDEFDAATVAQDDATAAHAAAADAEAAAAGRVALAKDHAVHAQREAELTALLDAAAARRATADRIRADHARLVELNAALPTLAKLVPARDARARLIPERDRLTAQAEAEAEAVQTATAERDRQREAGGGHKLRADEAATALTACDAARAADAAALKVADEVERIDRELAAFPVDLDERQRAAAADQTAARAAATAARDAHVAARTELKQREKELTDFGTVEAGATCSRCRQAVTAEHAAAERQALEDAASRLRAAAATAKAAEADAKARETAADAAHAALATSAAARDTLAAQRVGLTRHAAPPPAADLRARLADHEREAARLAAVVHDERAKGKAADAAAKDAETARAAAAARLAAAQARLQTANEQYIQADSTVKALLDHLTGAWVGAWDALAAADLDRLAAERVRLKATDVEADFRALGEDDALDADRARQRDAARAAVAAIPEAARVPVADAEAAAKAARAAADAAAAARTAAAHALAALHARQAKRAELVAAEKAAEAAARAHRRLDELLGADGLQRELVRAAERQIVRYADETVRHLSDGDLSVALDDGDDGPDKAFTLKVLRADDPTPIGVHYLSGSQKFRVAVAVALGIGRFATAGTQARPLESVVIDEGFGSLDPDGLRCMADELHRLKDRLALKRVVLVSHQEEFVARFPVGYRLAPGAAGTTAEPFRR